MATSRSIRFKISALLVIPLLSLAALWIFVASLTTGESVKLLSVDTLYQEIVKPAGELTIALQKEHLLSAEYLSRRSAVTQSALVQQRQETDKARERLRQALTEEAQATLVTPEMRDRFGHLMAMIGRLDLTRALVDNGRTDLVTLTRDFSQTPDAAYKLIASMAFVDDVAAYRQARSLNTMAYAHDLLSRERALTAGALLARRRMSPPERRLFAELAANRRFLFDQGVSELEQSVRDPFDKLADSQQYILFTVMEDNVLAGREQTFTHALWRSQVDEIDAAYLVTLTKAGDAFAASAQPKAIATFVRTGLAGVLGLAGVIVSLVVSLRVGRRLTRELGELRDAAADLAAVRLPHVIERLRRGEEVDVDAEAPPLALAATTREIRDVSAAFGSVQRTAVAAAVDQADLRVSVGKAFRGLARRSQSLIQRQLKQLEGMQRRVEDPETLRDLFKVDHLTTRMRRHAEGLVILSGGSPGRTFRQEVPVMDALRAAVGEAEDYTRVRVHPMPQAAIRGNVVADVIHLCAELVENATSFSPPNTEVSVRGDLVARGFAVEIEDRGLGMTPEEREALNRKLSRPPEFDPSDTERLGLYVIGRIAARRGIKVELRPSPFGGTTAIVLLPEDLIRTPERAPDDLSGLGEPAPRPPARFEPLAQETATGSPGSQQADVPHRRQSGSAPPAGEGGLPRRVRQANLAPQLRQEPPSAPQASGPLPERSPEQSRALLNSLQSGWRRGRADSERDGEEV
ncbi:sensor histidine kinase [Sphaerisporangium fuscum]|uniref:sensor histidine kinase n=1 Tax=Sphaerisporangium fuscum TaxID=2835868 RepID=UPI001BDDC41C|nr:nitrate- and nitrite sensing domain-containing protein [Sphaerisporangium fuscum]